MSTCDLERGSERRITSTERRVTIHHTRFRCSASTERDLVVRPVAFDFHYDASWAVY